MEVDVEKAALHRKVEAEIEVLMAAYDSDRTPTIMLSGKQLPADQVSNG